MKRCLIWLLCLSLLLSGCASTGGIKRYTTTYLDLFDTVTTITGYASSQADFDAAAQEIYETLRRYHQLFDIYNSYEGIANLKTLNEQAGLAPVQVDAEIIRLLQDCKRYEALTGGVVNAALGSVLQLWHQARQASLADPENAYVPDSSLLAAAAAHTSLDGVVVDEQASTVSFTDPQLQLDVGAIAKGWAAQRAWEEAPEGYLISVGGNVCATGPKPDGSAWVVGIQDPDGGSQFLQKLSLSSGCVVTSGDYQRVYTVEGKAYHHIIDPATLQPGTLWRSVSVVCQDSALADVLSTALFLLPQEQGQALLDQCGAQALWVDAQGRILYSPGLTALD